MKEDHSMTMERAAGADAICGLAIAIGAEQGVVVSEREWEIGTDLGHAYAHRLDLGTASSSVRLYFSDLDLTAPGNETRKERVVDRLRRAIAQLVPRTPSPMYNCR